MLLDLLDCEDKQVSSLRLQVKVALDSLMDNLTSLSDIGDCVARVEHLLKELKSLEEKARVSPHYVICIKVTKYAKDLSGTL